MALTFDVASMISAIGETIVISGVSASSLNEYGDATFTESSASCNVIVQDMTSEDDEVITGLLMPGDLEVYVNDADANLSKWALRSRFSWRGNLYTMKEVNINPGHYLCTASKD